MKNFYLSNFAGVPQGQNENSPAFQRRDRRAEGSSPEGTDERVRHKQSQPSLRDKAAAFLTATMLCTAFSAVAQVGGGGPGSNPKDTTLLDKSAVAARPEELKFPPLNYQPPAPEQFRVQLKSGAIAYIVPDRELPLVSIAIYIHTGEYVEPAGKEGLASFTGYLLARGGAGTNSADQLEERLAFLAAGLGSDISGTQGSVSMNLLSKDLDEGLSILKDVLFAPRFQDDKIALRKQQLLQSMEQRNDDTSSIEGREAGFLAYGEKFWDNQYSTKASIDSITREDLEAFHRKWFVPANFVIAVSGDFDRDEMIAKLDKLFSGAIGRTVPNPPVIPTNTVFAAPGAYLVNKPEVNQGRVDMMLPGITRDNPDYFSIIVMNDILGGGGFTSRIMNRVRTEEGLAYDAHTSFPGGVYYPLTFSVGYQSKSRTVAYAASLAIEEIKKLQSAPPTDLELTTSKRGFIDRFPGLFSTKSRVASIFAQEEFTGRYAKDPEFYKKYRDRIGAVTAQDVQRVAQKYLDLSKLVMLAVGNKDDILLGYPTHPVKFQDLAGGKFTELPLRDPMTMKVLPLGEEKKP
jgi:predicted Zn-dependent peptidase